MRVFPFDTETTDLIKNRHAPLQNQPHITELYAQVIELKQPKKPTKSLTPVWKDAQEFDQLFNPTIPLAPKIQQITGLTDAMLKEQPLFKAKAQQVKDLIESCDMVVAHNLSFDQAMVEIEMRRAGLTVTWPKRMVCTVEATEHILGRRLKLIELHQHLFGEPFEGAHRAKNDVLPMIRCFKELWARGLI